MTTLKLCRDAKHAGNATCLALESIEHVDVHKVEKVTSAFVSRGLLRVQRFATHLQTCVVASTTSKQAVQEQEQSDENS